MAKQRAAKRNTQARTGPKAAATGSGPVTLSQAQALARARLPGSTGGKAARPAPSPAAVGLERERLERQQDREKQRRIREYEATLAIMKRRGVKGLAAKARKRGPKAKAAGKPLQVFAEGDSWFEYPKPEPFFGGSIIPRLEKRLGVPILNLAKAGDEVRYMLGVKERKELIKQFTNGCPAGGKWDALLFSGGGNDMVDNPMALWIRDFDASVPPAKLIHQSRFDAALALVRAGYEDLIGLRDEFSPVTHLFLHAYDFAIPDGRGICHLGPWLKPTFDLRKFPTLAPRVEVMKEMLTQFAAMLAALQRANQGTVTLINGQGTLEPVAESWDNELHPEKKGFNAFAGLFHAALKARFPTRVL